MSKPSDQRGIRDSGADSDVPPMVTCARCGKPDCAGCAVVTSRPNTVVALEWEGGAGHWLARLWLTALASSTEPRKTFGALRQGPVLPALVFALLAEALALGSVAAALVVGALTIAPELSLRILATPVFLAAGLGALGALALLMVLLHVLWGLCIELGARRAGDHAHFGQGLRFGLYACGWDLVTSPAGVVGGLYSRGLRGAFGPVVQAARVPRAALRAYVEECRQLGPEAQRRGVQLSVLVLGGLSLAIFLTVLVALYRFAQSIGF